MSAVGRWMATLAHPLLWRPRSRASWFACTDCCSCEVTKVGIDAALPAINEAVNFAHDHQPALLTQLAALGNEYAEVVRPGIWGGAEELVEFDGERKRMALTVRATVVAAALDAAVIEADRALVETGKLLARVKAARFVSAAFSSISASGVVAAALMNKQVVTIVLSILSLGSNLALLTIDTLFLGG